MIQKLFKLFSLALLFSLAACSKNVKPSTYYSPNFKDGGVDRHDGLGFEIPVKYAIEVFYFNENPKQSYEVIDLVSISGEVPLEDKQTVNGKMLNRGNHQLKKQELLSQMVEKATEMGASALMDVKYQVYSTQYATGYTFSGKAIRYVLK
ncbi:hypothetical protein [Aquirufa rosea]|uniref:Heavy metal-binding domain-containing protein n=1 Tax=Aquirufa rosea TaxID=2509241 RepID=A0A4Q1C287_9BACT|nr:hypothetical protein [Aquirufa rosea]RXK52283.1 hypothetical protein ESB04_01145 [Aquirufa rosea]